MLTACLDARSIEICCETDPGNCTRYALEHSLIQFDEKPAILEIPAESSTRCSLTARGLALDVFQVVILGIWYSTVVIAAGLATTYGSL